MCAVQWHGTLLDTIPVEFLTPEVRRHAFTSETTRPAHRIRRRNITAFIRSTSHLIRNLSADTVSLDHAPRCGVHPYT